MQTVLWNEEVTEKNPVFPGQLQIYCYEHLKKKQKQKQLSIVSQRKNKNKCWLLDYLIINNSERFSILVFLF